MTISGIGNTNIIPPAGKSPGKTTGKNDATEARRDTEKGSTDSSLPASRITDQSRIESAPPIDLNEARNMLAGLKSSMQNDPDLAIKAHSGRKILMEGLLD